MRSRKMEKFSDLADEGVRHSQRTSGLIGTDESPIHELWRQNFTLLWPYVADGLTILL